jgi:hypothetical protein
MTNPPQTTPKSGNKLPSAFQIWLEEAWHGWLKHVSGILFIGVVFLLYQADLLNERLGGLILALGVALGTLGMAVLPARDHVKSSGQRFALYALSVVWAVCAILPIVKGVYPGGTQGAGSLWDEGSEITLQSQDGGKEIFVSGKLLGGGGDVKAGYKIASTWQGGTSTVEGALTRMVSRVRVGRRGSGTSVTEFNEQKHFLGRTTGPVKLRLEERDQTLDKGVEVELRSNAIPPLLLMILGGLVFAAALVLDRALDPKGRTTLAVSAAISLWFANYFFDEVQPHHVVRPAIGALLMGVIIGGAGGWVVSTIFKKLTAEKKPRKARAA